MYIVHAHAYTYIINIIRFFTTNAKSKNKVFHVLYMDGCKE